MIPMTGDEDKLKYFITSIQKEEDQLVIKYASGEDDCSKYSLHNLNAARNRMIDQARECLPNFISTMATEYFKTIALKYAAILGGIIGLFFLYNIDIHIIMKIIITLLALGGEVVYYLINKVYLAVLDMASEEALATKYYINNLADFRYYNPELGQDEFILPIEDISKYCLCQKDLEELSKIVKDFKSKGYESKEITLSYKPNPKTSQEN